MPQVYVLDLVKMDVQVHLYRRLHSDFDLHEDMLAHENGRADFRADVHTDEYENDFDVAVEDVNEKVDVDVDVESVGEDIAGGLSVIVVVKLDVVVDLIGVGECWRQPCRRELKSDFESANVEKSRVECRPRVLCEEPTGTSKEGEACRIKGTDGSRQGKSDRRNK